MRVYEFSVEGRTLPSTEELIKLRFKLESDEFKVAAHQHMEAIAAQPKRVPRLPALEGAFQVRDDIEVSPPRIVMGAYKPEVAHERYNFVETAIRAYKRSTKGPRCVAVLECPPTRRQQPDLRPAGQRATRQWSDHSFIHQAGANLGLHVSCKTKDTPPKDYPLVAKSQAGVEYMVAPPLPLEECIVSVFGHHSMDEVDLVEVQLLLVLERKAEYREVDDTERAWARYRETARSS